MTSSIVALAHVRRDVLDELRIARRVQYASYRQSARVARVESASSRVVVVRRFDDRLDDSMRDAESTRSRASTPSVFRRARRRAVARTLAPGTPASAPAVAVAAVAVVVASAIPRRVAL